MAQAQITFDDSAAYERFMGRWSRAVAPVFLGWLGARAGARWLDVGCGTGILAQTLLELSAPRSVHAVDSSAAQVEAAAQGPAAGRATFRVADARKLPYADASFDVVASALVINFIPERPPALAEMRRVARPEGIVAGYVWDFSQELSPSGPLRRTMRRLGAEVPAIPGAEDSRVEALEALFQGAGLEQIETRTIDVCLGYEDFSDFWQAQTPAYAPTTKVIAAMKQAERARLMNAVQSALPCGPNGSIEYCARANAIKARVPRF
ncbi:MAG TPA: class I SAM-dependent methyltransferase [Burkholderiales bacterium]|nr:class I SAM-dependent methyltransferase [Burkholderiales bacterium]